MLTTNPYPLLQSVQLPADLRQLQLAARLDLPGVWPLGG